MSILFVTKDALGRVVELNDRGWKHIQRGHASDFPSLADFKPEARSALMSPARAWVAPANTESTESQGFAGCSLNEQHSSKYVLVFVQDAADAFIKSARRVNELPWHARKCTQLLDPGTLRPCVKTQTDVKERVNAANRQKRRRDA